MEEIHGSWIKFFEDDSKEYGSDLDIQSSKASWSRGRQDKIKEVFLSDGICSLVLTVPNTNWYQFDRYITSLGIGVNTSFRTYRVIQAEIKSFHVDSYLIGFLSNQFFGWAVLSEKEDKAYNYCYQIQKTDIGKWVSLSILKEGRISISFTSKGKI